MVLLKESLLYGQNHPNSHFLIEGDPHFVASGDELNKECVLIERIKRVYFEINLMSYEHMEPPNTIFTTLE